MSFNNLGGMKFLPTSQKDVLTQAKGEKAGRFTHFEVRKINNRLCNKYATNSKRLFSRIAKNPLTFD